MAEKQFLTKKGYDERVARLEELKVVRRKEVAQKLKEAREQGDLSENAEYDAAKDEQRDIETEIAELEAILANCEVIQDNDKNKDVVKMESVVVLHDVEFDEDIEYTIVGSSEADSLNNKISNESPLGAALIGKKKGDTVKVEAPVACNHKQLPAKTIVKRTVIKKTDTSYVPLLYIAEPGEKVDSTNHDFTIRKGELRDYIQIASNVRK